MAPWTVLAPYHGQLLRRHRSGWMITRILSLLLRSYKRNTVPLAMIDQAGDQSDERGTTNQGHNSTINFDGPRDGSNGSRDEVNYQMMLYNPQCQMDPKRLADRISEAILSPSSRPHRRRSFANGEIQTQGTISGSLTRGEDDATSRLYRYDVSEGELWLLFQQSSNLLPRQQIRPTVVSRNRGNRRCMTQTAGNNIK